MAIQLFLLHFVMMPGQCQARGSSGVVKTRSFNNRMYQILVCLRSLVLRRVLESYTHVYMGIPEICTSRYTNCQALLSPRRKCSPQQHFADEGSFAGNTLTDCSKKNVPTKRGVAGVVADEDPTRESWCGGGPTRRFCGGAARRQPSHWCRCRSRRLRTQ